MDVNLVLHELRELCGEALALADSGIVNPSVQAIATRFDLLDQHMSSVGRTYAPDAWREMEDHR